MSSPHLLLLSTALILTLAACTNLQRADDAATAKTRMIGMSREEVLSCMGVPKKKAAEGTTEVWSYLSTSGHGESTGAAYKPTGYAVTSSEHDHSFCTVNIVMKDGAVKAVHYNGPTSSSLFSKDDQCGYAIANCVN